MLENEKKLLIVFWPCRSIVDTSWFVPHPKMKKQNELQF